MSRSYLILKWVNIETILIKFYQFYICIYIEINMNGSIVYKVQLLSLPILFLSMLKGLINKFILSRNRRKRDILQFTGNRAYNI